MEDARLKVQSVQHRYVRLIEYWCVLWLCRWWWRPHTKLITFQLLLLSRYILRFISEVLVYCEFFLAKLRCIILSLTVSCTSARSWICLCVC